MPNSSIGFRCRPGVAAGHPLPARDDLLDDEVEGERGDGEVDALEAQRRQADDMPTAGRQQRRAGQRDDERHAARLQQRLGVGADGEERRVAERDLAGEADQQHQAEADDGVDADELQLRQHVLADQPAARRAAAAPAGRTRTPGRRA